MWCSPRLALPDYDSSHFKRVITPRVFIAWVMPHDRTRVPCRLVGVQVWEGSRLAQEGLREPHVLVLDSWKRDALPGDGLLCQGQELPFGGASTSSELRRNCWPAIRVDTPEEGEKALDAVTRLQMFGEHIRRVVVSTDFDQLNGSVADSLLNPQTLRVNVSQLAQTLPATNAHRCNAVCPDAHRQAVAEVFDQRLVAKAGASRLNHSVELRFSTAQGDGGLG